MRTWISATCLVEVPGHDALPHQFHTIHHGLDTAPAVMYAPSSLYGAAQISRRIDPFISGYGTSARGLPRFGVLARGHDSIRPPSGNRVVTFARVVVAQHFEDHFYAVGTQ